MHLERLTKKGRSRVFSGAHRAVQALLRCQRRGMIYHGNEYTENAVARCRSRDAGTAKRRLPSPSERKILKNGTSEVTVSRAHFKNQCIPLARGNTRPLAVHYSCATGVLIASKEVPARITVWQVGNHDPLGYRGRKRVRPRQRQSCGKKKPAIFSREKWKCLRGKKRQVEKDSLNLSLPSVHLLKRWKPLLLR